MNQSDGFQGIQNLGIFDRMVIRLSVDVAFPRKTIISGQFLVLLDLGEIRMGKITSDKRDELATIAMARRASFDLDVR